MRSLAKILILACLFLPTGIASSQVQQEKIDSLVDLLSTAGRDWNDYSKPLIEIGEPAVPALVRLAEDKGLEQWNRRVAIMTLNAIHSEQWKEPALKILFNRQEDPVLRNQVTGGLHGFDLSGHEDILWKLFIEESNEFHRSNLAFLLASADTSMAYRAFSELYRLYNGHVQKSALMQLISLRPNESTEWLVDAIQLEDWMTSNLAMDSLIVSKYFRAGLLIDLYNENDTEEKVRWRIIYIFGHREEPESVPLLLSAFQDESWLLHTEATVGLCRFDPDRVIPGMRSFRRDNRSYIRNNARWVIHNMQN